ncbi:HlyD family secretion protein [Acidiphilium acidophilum]|uniref:HlyD family secretion protein n=1 Tax=Acidiphilium acidophilum TaxID=76588 RepID=UPI002E8E7117|nr:HlyD family secretion protein [Acidiphilium acidophilum]
MDAVNERARSNRTPAGASQAPDSAGDAPSRPRSRRPFLILAAVLLVLVIAGVVYWLHARHFATTDDAQIDGPIHRISARISGQVVSVPVHQNEHVTKGQILVVLDNRTEQVAVDRARAQRAQAAADVGTRQADLMEANANVEVAQADLVKAQQDATRYQRVNPQAITRTNLDAATSALRAAQARVDAAKAQVSAAKAGLVAAKASLRAAGVAVESAQLQLGYTTIRAPASGSIAERTVRTGNVVSPGSGLMALVGDRYWVTANYKETELGRIHPGQHVRVYIDAVPGIGFHAVVSSIQRGTGSVFSLLPAENATGNYVKIVQRVPVRITFDDKRLSKNPVSPGMSVEPYIRISGK